jgi:hypothetical protein
MARLAIAATILLGCALWPGACVSVAAGAEAQISVDQCLVVCPE